MYDFFVASQESRLQHAPELPCYVIPFSNNFERISRLSKTFNFRILQTDLQKWDELGETIWGHTSHRPNVEKKSYFRKLAMFEAPTEHFLFVDANTIFTDKIAFAINLFARSELDISFLSYSLPGRNFQHGGLIDLLDQINQKVRHGFNCGFILGRQDLALYDTMKILASPGPRLQRVFGGAPEQAFLSYVAGLTGKKMARFIDILPQATTEQSTDEPLIQRGGNTMFGANSRTPGKRTFFLKWNGAKLHEGLSNFDVLDGYYKAGLARIDKT